MTTPTTQAQSWLDTFGEALPRGDASAAASLFEEDCYWRDLVSFTWNIKTAEGREAVRGMLEATLAATRPSHWRVEGDASEAGGVTEAWFTFETAAARGKGLLRLKGDRCWTLLTTMVELKGFEERRGAAREQGVEHGVHPGRKSWAELRAQEAAELGFTKQPYVLSSGAARAASRSGRGCAASVCRRSSSRRMPGPATAGASATRACACTIRSGTTTCRTSPSRTTGRCSARRTRSATGSRCIPA